MSAISVISFCLSVVAYALKELQSHGKLKWSKSYNGFWGEDSSNRKYKKDWSKDPLGYDMFLAPNTWYYRFFKIKYKERFPLSATALVFLTDGYHLCQWFFTKLLILSIITFEGDFSIKWFLIYLGIWYLIFNITYKLLSK